jgi:glyoxylase-like metal-dependent hydrolase (beta-lactamase superfamily II)
LNASIAPPPPRRLAPDLYLLDLVLGGTPGVGGCYLLAGEGELTLVECGPASTLPALLAGVRAAGYDPGRITRLLLTHIHLDHAGAAGSLVARLPAVTVYVHPRGLPHLADPSRLVASARRIYGERMEELWGEILPVPEERLVPVDDHGRILASGRQLHALDTPGHAGHHLVFHDPARREVFTGDVAGIRLDAAYVQPPTPPPELDLEAWRRSLLRLRTLRPERLFLTHFGAYEDVDWHLDDLLARLHAWWGWLAAARGAGTAPQQLAEALRAREADEIGRITGGPEGARRYEEATPHRMLVDGLLRHLAEREAVEPPG